MKIKVRSGIGNGPTELSAFDQALVNAGVANFNLICLSSVIPPESKIEIEDTPLTKIEGQWGDRLYVVMAQQRTSQRNKEVCAGVGWIQDPDTNHGLLVEHEGHNETEVRADIENSLAALAANRDMKFGPVQMQIVGTKCVDLPVCALVIAVFESASWEKDSRIEKKFLNFNLRKSIRQ